MSTLWFPSFQSKSMTSEESEAVTESVAESVNPRRTRRRRLRRPKSRERPATATLAHPSILDETLKVQNSEVYDVSRQK